ncbi:MAG: DNA polymerase III subunit chi [Acetobacteraceae bacterium]
MVLCGSEARVAALDDALWAAAEPDWLPHGSARTGEADLQPIWLTAVPEAPNGARYLFLIDSTDTDAGPFERVFDLFDGTDEAAVQAARRRWTAAKAAGHQLTYWQQGERGWERRPDSHDSVMPRSMSALRCTSIRVWTILGGGGGVATGSVRLRAE